jgi:ABC-type lipoprotein release transport system permease subunit
MNAVRDTTAGAALRPAASIAPAWRASAARAVRALQGEQQ